MFIDNEKTLILGLGNDILSDDAIGIIVVRRLSEIFKDRGDFEFKFTTEMGLSLLDYIEGYSRLIVIDSLVTGNNPVSTVKELDINDFPGTGCTAPHFLGLKDTIELGKRMGMSMPDSVLILGIEVEDPFSVSEKLSPRLAEHLDEIVKSVQHRIENYCEIT